MAQTRTGLPLEITLSDSVHVGRTCGPIRLELKCNWQGSGVLQGQLEIAVVEPGGDLLGSFVVDDLYLSPGIQTQELMLPGFRSFGRGELSLYLTVRDSSGSKLGDFPPMTLRVVSEPLRALTIALCRSERNAGRRQEQDWADALRMENLQPPEARSNAIPTLVTRSIDLFAETAPAEPLRLCAYDMVLLPASGLELLADRQLSALLAWTRAGGAVCVILDESDLKARHLDFLHDLAGAPRDAGVFLKDPGGELVLGSAAPPAAPLTYHCGLGRVAVIPPLDDWQAQAAPHWHATAAHLYRVRREHAESIASAGVWDRAKTLEFVQKQASAGIVEYGDSPELAAQQADNMGAATASGGSGLVTRLLPAGLKIMPLSTIFLMLLLYVCLIGPLDYVVLGALRLRRWTWVVFPAITLVLTIGTVMISNQFMSTADHRGSVVFRDLAPGPKFVRENTLDVLFPSSTRIVETDVGRGLFMPLRFQDFGQVNMYGYGYPYNTDWQNTRVDPAIVQGRMPIRAAARQRVPQWTPQLNRRLTIPLAVKPGNTPLPEFDWDAPAKLRSDEFQARVTALVEAAFPRADAYLFHLSDVHVVSGAAQFFDDGVGNQYYNSWTGGYSYRQSNFLRDVCVVQQPGFGGVVYQYAPTGGDRFEDMTLLDPTDPRHWLLVIALTENGRPVIYRRLYVLDQ